MNENDYSMHGFRNWKNFLALALITVVSAFLNFSNLDIGLPSNERLVTGLGGQEAAERGLKALNPDYSAPKHSEFLAKDNPDNFRELARYSPYFDQARSYNPDEFHVFKVLADMYQRRDPRPESYIYGAFFFYQMGFPLAVGKATGYIDSFKSADYYLTHPEEMRPFYLCVRFLCALFQTLAVTVTFLAAWRIFRLRGAVFSSLLMAMLPLVTVGAAFIKADPPVLFWSVLTLFFSIPILKSDRYFNYIAAGICAGLAAASKYPAVFTFSYIFMFHLLRRQQELGSWRLLRPGKPDKPLLASLGCAFGTGLLVSAPMLWDLKNTFIAASYHLNTSRPGNLWFNLIDTLLNYVHDALFFTYGIPAALIVLAGVVLIFVKPQRIWMAMLPMIVFFFYTAAKGLPSSDMYTLPAIPPLCLMACYAWEMVKPRALRIALAAVIMIVTFSYSLAYIQCGYRENVRITASRWIQENIPVGSSIGTRFYPVSYRFPMVPPDKYRFLSIDVDLDKTYDADYFVVCSFDLPRVPFWPRITRGESYDPPPEYHYEAIKSFEDVPRALFGLVPLERNYFLNYYFEIYRPKFVIYRKMGKQS